jgi:ribose transport system ATP-binding protein
MIQAASPYRLEARRVTKTFPGVKALQDVSIHLKRGSIHALLGENGAGKSTLIKVITGVHQPDSGEILLDGVLAQIRNAHHGSSLGLSVVHQERHLVPRFSVGENIMLDRLARGRLGTVDYDSVHREAAKWLGVLGLDLDPRTRVYRLSMAQMQLVEIAKALSHQSRVLLMDEPTASLTPHETETLFGLLRKLRDTGVTMVFVSHKLEEVLDISDEVTVLRDGRNACDSQPMVGMTRQDLVRLMIGRSEQIPNWSARSRSPADPVLELRGVATELGHRDINLTLHRGEILGLYGLVGAGRSELAKSIIGLFQVTAGEILVRGQPARIDSVATARDGYRIGYVSEDRKGEGLILIHSVLENAGITVWRRLASKFVDFLTDRAIRRAVEPVIRKLEVRTPSLDQTVNNLSGGNQQKVAVAKWIAAEVEILIVDEPSVGIDIKTKGYIHTLLKELTESGTSILLITSDMPEMITLADRIAVLDEYRLKGEFVNNRQYDRMSTEIMRLIHHEDEMAA